MVIYTIHIRYSTIQGMYTICIQVDNNGIIMVNFELLFDFYSKYMLTITAAYSSSIVVIVVVYYIIIIIIQKIYMFKYVYLIYY